MAAPRKTPEGAHRAPTGPFELNCLVADCDATFEASKAVGGCFCSAECAASDASQWRKHARTKPTRPAIRKWYDRRYEKYEESVAGGQLFMAIAARVGARGGLLTRSTHPGLEHTLAAIAACPSFFARAGSLAQPSTADGQQAMFGFFNAVLRREMSAAELRTALKVGAPADAAEAPGAAEGGAAGTADAAQRDTSPGGDAAAGRRLAAGAAFARTRAGGASDDDEGADEDDMGEDGDNDDDEADDEEDEDDEDGEEDEEDEEDEEENAEDEPAAGGKARPAALGGKAVPAALGGTGAGGRKAAPAVRGGTAARGQKAGPAAKGGGAARRRRRPGTFGAAELEEACQDAADFDAEAARTGMTAEELVEARVKRAQGAARKPKKPRAAADSDDEMTGGGSVHGGAGGGTGALPAPAAARARGGRGANFAAGGGAGRAGGAAGDDIVMVAGGPALVPVTHGVGITNDNNTSCWAIALAQSVASSRHLCSAALEYVTTFLSERTAGKTSVSDQNPPQCLALLVARACGYPAATGRTPASSLALIMRPSDGGHMLCLSNVFGTVLRAEETQRGGPFSLVLCDTTRYHRRAQHRHTPDCHNRPPDISPDTTGFFLILDPAQATLHLPASDSATWGTYASLSTELLSPGASSTSRFVNAINACLRIEHGEEVCACLAGAAAPPRGITAAHYSGRPKVLSLFLRRDVPNAVNFPAAPDRLLLHGLGEPGAAASQPAHYRLVSVAYYRGSGGSGHYHVHGLRGGRWWDLNDAAATKLHARVLRAGLAPTPEPGFAPVMFFYEVVEG